MPTGKCLSAAACKTEVGEGKQWLCKSAIQSTADDKKYVKLCAPVNLNIIDARLTCTQEEEAA